ncbi:MAG: HD domain-containing phosphohydrolase [bacterium]
MSRAISIIRQPDFRVPLAKVTPGMTLGRNLEMNGRLLLRHGAVLDPERIDKLNKFGVDYVHVVFSDEDLDIYKGLLCCQDRPPDYHHLQCLARDTFLELVPAWARPANCARDESVSKVVNTTIEHTFDVLFSSRRLLELLRLSRMFQLETLRHCPVTWMYSLCIGAGLGYSLPTLLDLSLSALFYDIGMLKVPQEILSKPGRLTELEFAEIKKHVYFGRRLLEAVSDFGFSMSLVAFEHHEHYYGGGYPKNKRGDTIHEFSQIVGLADKFAALMTTRFHRDRFQPYQAYEMLLAQTKTAVSPRIFVAFLKHVLLYPRGSRFRLSTGEIAIPIEVPVKSPARPRVLITHSANGLELLGMQRELNLAHDPDVRIESFAIMDQYPANITPEDIQSLSLLD